MKFKLLFLVAVLAIILALCLRMVREYYEHTDMPPGWTLMQNDDGKYGAQFPESKYVIDRIGRGTARGMSRQEAINRAWRQYEYDEAEKRRESSWKPAP